MRRGLIFQNFLAKTSQPTKELLEQSTSDWRNRNKRILASASFGRGLDSEFRYSPFHSLYVLSSSEIFIKVSQCLHMQKELSHYKSQSGSLAQVIVLVCCIYIYEILSGGGALWSSSSATQASLGSLYASFSTLERDKNVLVGAEGICRKPLALLNS